MELGAFSISLTVKDLAASRAFYEKLGFEASSLDGGDTMEQNYLIMTNGLAVIGLFQGMFDRNILTFNPGLGQDKSKLEGFTDIRELRKRLADAGIEIGNDTTSDKPEGAASFTLTDPDGNPILIDQFF